MITHLELARDAAFYGLPHLVAAVKEALRLVAASVPLLIHEQSVLIDKRPTRKYATLTGSKKWSV